MAKILIVDDDPMFFEPFSFYLEEMGHQCEVAENLHDGLELARAHSYDIVFLDVLLPDASGLEGIVPLKKTASSPEIVMITGQGDSAGAETALKNGAWDYLEKPPSYSDIRLLVGRALEYRKKKHRFHSQELLDRDRIIGNDPSIRDCLEIVAKAAKSDGNVFITGETGTGKALMARAVHINSRRAKANFVTVDCTNLPVNLVENLLFGHTKGVFTGADRDRSGLVAQADGGTLFLDEVGDLHPSAQKSLLNVLQNKRFRPLGSKKEVACDFRVISATNKDLKTMVEAGQFRKDLYFRLVAFHMQLPPLRGRPGDIHLLTRHYVCQICDEFGIDTMGVSKDVMEILTGYEWPGNVRELINVLHTAIASAIDEPMLLPHHLPLDIRIHFRKCSIKGKQPVERKRPRIILEIDMAGFPTLKEFRRQAEARYLEQLINASNGDIQAALAMAGVSRSGLYQLMGKHGRHMK